MIQITITLTDDGQLEVDGPIHNPLQMHGILGMVASVVNELHAKTVQDQRVQLAPAGLMGLKV